MEEKIVLLLYKNFVILKRAVFESSYAFL